MGAIVNRYRAVGIELAALPDGNLRASGKLTDAHRATIRADKAAILAELVANDCATPEQAAELRRLVGIVAADWPDRDEALALALADPAAALMCFRALLAEREPVAREPSPAALPTCRECRNLTSSGRCLAAARRENFGVGIAVGARYEPVPDVQQRCAPFVPLPGDPDQRTGHERWPFLLETAKSR